VRDPEAHQLAIDRVADCVRELGGLGGDNSFADYGMEGTRSFCCMRDELERVSFVRCSR